MRKITHKESKKDVQRKRLLLAGVIIALLVLSTFGIVFQNAGSLGVKQNGEREDYNGFEFVYNNGFWLTQIGSSVFVFSNEPKNVAPLTEELMPLETYYAQELYYHSEDDFSTQVIQNNFMLVSRSITEGCLEGTCLNETNLPTINCEQKFISVEILDSGEGEVRQDNNCVFIKGTQNEIPLLLDRFFLKISGIQ